jgi:hypothetical protein
LFKKLDLAYFPPRRTWRLCSLPRRIAGSQILFFFSQSTKEIVVVRFAYRRPWRLGGFASYSFFFFSRKDGEAQRNYGPLGLTAEGLPVAVRKTFAA